MSHKAYLKDVVHHKFVEKMFQIVYYYFQVIDRPFHLKLGEVHTGRELDKFSIFFLNQHKVAKKIM